MERKFQSQPCCEFVCVGFTWVAIAVWTSCCPRHSQACIRVRHAAWW